MRRALLAGGVALWSFATLGTAFSYDFWHIFFWRSLLGIGEASYGVIAPTLIADLFPIKERGRAMGVYYLALPLGGALGYGVGSWIGQDFGWRAAFWVVGLPGLLAAVAGLVMIDPGRGASEGKAIAGKADRPGMRDYLGLFLIPTFVLNTAGMAAQSPFADRCLWRVHGSNLLLRTSLAWHVDEGGRQVDRRPDRRGRPGGDRPWHVPGRPPPEVHAARLPAARVRRRGRLGATGTVRGDPRTEDRRSRWSLLQRDRSCCRWCSGRATRSSPTWCRPTSAPRATRFTSSSSTSSATSARH